MTDVGQLERRSSSSRTRTRDQGLMSRFQRGNRLFTRHRGECIEELVETVSALEIVDQIPPRDSRALEDGRPAQNIWIAVNDGS